MKRRNTADKYMIEDFAKLRKEGVRDFFCTTDYYKENGDHRYLKPVMKHTAQGVSAYANAMWNKYGDSVTVEVGYFNNNCDYIKYTKYHA